MWVSSSPGPAGALLPAPPPRLTWQTAVGGWGAALSRSSRWARASWDRVMSSPLEGAAGWGDRWGQGSLLKGTCRETIPLSKYSPPPPGLAPRRRHLTGDWGPAGNSCPSLATGGRLPTDTLLPSLPGTLAASRRPQQGPALGFGVMEGQRVLSLPPGNPLKQSSERRWLPGFPPPAFLFPP